MKKTFPVNINGKIFYIDEDAYKLLQDYLSQLRATFPGQEGSEIVSDIECRISELFDERILSGANVIVLEDVNNVIEEGATKDQPAHLHPTPNVLPVVLPRLPFTRNCIATFATKFSEAC